ncbi:uncharacterized protein LOC133178913 [Saccostrea echinata]|uniref:uncharacterized protein LOC133178913 n=1 Tax=Saccostrea echinata TaxID=191078 RepID=UPI002A822DC5|nr:uncharacterized protein LOC133178913 [Saccostrea echinata]
MNAAVLTSDNSNWRPTVVQIAPFLHDSRSFPKLRPSTSITNPNSESKEKRNYPVLAVTRTNSFITSDSDRPTNDDGLKVPFSGRPPTEFIKSFYRGKILNHDNYVNASFPDCVDKKCSIQDLNFQNLDIHREPEIENQMDQSQFPAMTNNKTTKSVLSERKFFYGTNGIMRSLHLTPGELELQKHKENYAREQAQKKKKYKLNVNQLPRSTTPINDHDPDKLNMKQVIQFLQNKSEIKIVSKKQPGKLSINCDPQKLSTVGVRPKTETIIARQRISPDCVRPSTELPKEDGKSESESRIASRSSSYSRDSYGSRSVLSTQSVPIMDSKGKRNHSKMNPSSRSVKDRGRHSRRSVKEFKLHRFLALAPNGMGQTTAPNNQVEESGTIFISDKEKCSERQIKRKATDEFQGRVTYRSPMIREQVPAYQFSENKLEGNKISAKEETGTRKLEQRKVSRASSLMHRKALSQFREKVRLIRAEHSEEDDEQKNTTIRLPSVHDYEDSVRHLESEDDEAISADISYPEQDEKGQEIASLLSSRSDQTCNRSVSYHPSLVIQTDYLDNNNNNNRQLVVNIPKQTDAGNKEMIKLTLRQEKDVTREQSYMHDIATPREHNVYTMMCQHLKQTLPPSGDNSLYNRRVYRISAVSINEDEKYDTLPDGASLTVHETLANSCIKVRQKLKGAVHNE